jgi:hypothetical protein
VSLKSWLGLDWFDLLVQAALTAVAGVIVTSLWHGEDGDVAVASVLGLSTLVLAVRRQRSMRHQLEEPAVVHRLADLEDRLEQVERQCGSMAELEERLDFAERLLAQHRDPPRLAEAGREGHGQVGRGA